MNQTEHISQSTADLSQLLRNKIPSTMRDIFLYSFQAKGWQAFNSCCCQRMARHSGSSSGAMAHQTYWADSTSTSGPCHHKNEKSPSDNQWQDQNSMKWNQGRFRLDNRQRFFTPRVAGHWNRFPRQEITAPSLIRVQNTVEFLGLSCTGSGVGLNPGGPLLTQHILWFGENWANWWGGTWQLQVPPP